MGDIQEKNNFASKTSSSRFFENIELKENPAISSKGDKSRFVQKYSFEVFNKNYEHEIESIVNKT